MDYRPVLILCCHLVLGYCLDPYRVLGVSRSAGSREIKKAYVRLAKEWHPDKNSDPGAEDKFIEVQQSYEILSDEEKRSRYDQFGQTDFDSPQSQQHAQHQGFSEFGGGNFHFKFNSNSGNSKYRINGAQFDSHIMPNSHKKPYLIFARSSWCFVCGPAETEFEKAAESLEQLGVGMGTVNVDYDRHLLNALNLDSVPAVVGVMDERLHYLSSPANINVQRLREFVQYMLPKDFITKVNDDNYRKFLSSAEERNKPSVLLFSKKPEQPLLFQLMALENRQFQEFGFVQIGKANTEAVADQYHVNLYQPTLLIFKEDILVPAAELSASSMHGGATRDTLSANRYLKLPRLASQDIFTDLCPESPVQRRLCVILVSSKRSHRDIFRTMLSSLDHMDRVSFMYTSREMQPKFVKAFDRLQNDPETSDIIVLWRKHKLEGLYDLLKGGWKGLETDMDNFRLFLDTVLANKKNLLLQKASFPELNNEAENLFDNIVHSIKSTYKQTLRYFGVRSWKEALLTVMMSSLYLLPVLLIVFMVPLTSRSQVPPRAPPRRTRTARTEEQPRPATSNNYRQDAYDPYSEIDRNLPYVPFKELKRESYQNAVVNMPAGQRLLVVFVNEQARTKLIHTLTYEVAHLARSRDINKFMYLMVTPTALAWYKSIGNAGQSLLPQRQLGKLLVINGHRKYYHEFEPQKLKNASSGTQDFVGLDSDSETEDVYGSDQEVTGCKLWLDKVVDGGVPKVKVEEWPPWPPDVHYFEGII